MDITRNNYESWFLDYLDGNLTAEQEEVLMSFLEFNPDLKAELEGTENLVLEAKELDYDLKASLRKPLSNPVYQDLLDNFEDYCIAGIEEQLSPEEEEMLKEIIEQDEARKNIYNLYGSTLLKADTSIIFPGKARLKRRYISITVKRISIASAAAAAILLIALPLIFRNTATEQLTDVVQDPDVSENGIVKESTPSSGQLADKITTSAEDRIDTPIAAEKTSAIVSTPLNEIPPDWQPEIENREIVSLSRIEPIKATSLYEFPNSTVSAMAYRIRSEGYRYVSFAELASQHTMAQNKKERKISLWRLADAGIQRIDQISEEDYSFDRNTDETGRTRRITFETPLFGISAPMRNPNNP